MSTSVVMMDTSGAAGHGHRRTAGSNSVQVNASNTNSSSMLHHHHIHHLNHHHQSPFIDLKTTSTNNNNNNLANSSNNNNSNVPINFAMKFFNSSSSSSSSNSTTSSATTSPLNSVRNSIHKTTIAASSSPIGATPTTPRQQQVQVKLEPRVPSPCTADLALLAQQQQHQQQHSQDSLLNNHKLLATTRVPSPKDLSFYFSKSATITNNSTVISTTTPAATTLVMTNGVPNGTTTTGTGVEKHQNESQEILFSSSSSSSSCSSSTSPIPNGTTTTTHSSHQPQLGSSPSPPLLMKPYNNHSSPSNTSLNGNVVNVGMKRHHDEAFGHHSSPSSPIINPNTTAMMNGHNHHPQLIQLPTTPGNGGSINNNNNSMVASPSSSYSDFGGSTCKEEMSPSNSVNGYTSVDSLGGDPKKKKGPAPRQQEELCLVCGDRASGYHYNALTCEGCKGFFRRSITRNAVYQCKYGNNCEIDMYMRRKCQECRLKKCLSVGMRPECVVPEYQCAIKREAKRANKDKDKPNSTTKEGLSPNTNQMMIEDKQPLTPLMSHQQNAWNNGPMSNGGCGSGGSDVEIIRKLSPEQDEIIRKLVFCQDEFESPAEEDIKKIAPFPLGDNEEDNKKRFQHVTEMTILTVQLIVEFSKRVPYFDTLFRDDQITLLKACSSEVMMLRCSRKYDIKTDSIVYANNQPYTRQNYSSACISYVADTLFNFCRRMHMLKVDNAEYALLTAIVIFSDRPHLLEPHKVEEIQEKYIETLRIYVENRRPPNKCHFAKLLGILTELRTLGNINSEMCISLRVQNKKLPPFLAEIWDIQDS